MDEKLFLVALSAAMVVATSTSTARADHHDRGKVFDVAVADHETVLVHTDVGLFVSRDHGTTWQHVCSLATGLGNGDQSRIISPRSRAFVASTFWGIVRAEASDTCTWSRAAGAADDVFIDVASKPGFENELTAYASSYEGQDDAGASFFFSRLYTSHDEGRTFSLLTDRIDPTLLGYSIAYGRVEPARFYLTGTRGPGTQTPSAAFLTSADGGGSWVEHPVALEGEEQWITIAAVDASDRVYLRTRAVGRRGERVLVTEDRGETFRVLVRSPDDVSGFALSTDGTRAYVASVGGLQAASTVDFVWEQRSRVPLGCLHVADDGIWACTGFTAVGLSVDEGHTFLPKFDPCVSAAECGDDTPGGTCAGMVPDIHAYFACAYGDRDAGVEPLPPEPESGSCSASSRSLSISALAPLLAGFLLARVLRRRR